MITLVSCNKNQNDLHARYTPPPLFEELFLKVVLVLLKTKLDAYEYTAPQYAPAELQLKMLFPVKLIVVFCEYIIPPANTAKLKWKVLPIM